jgi:hypothetical protein
MPLSRRALFSGAAASAAAAAAVPVLRLPKKVRIGMIGLDGHTSEILTPLGEIGRASCRERVY